MSTFEIKIDMPVFERPFSASCSRVEKLSGVQYLLLKIIGTRPFRSKSWRDVMEVLRIPEEVYEKIFEKDLEEMASSKVIEISGGTDIDSEIGSMDFTPVGRQAFDKGVIAQQVENFKGNVAFTPWRSSKKFAKSTSKISDPSKGLSAKFADMSVDLLGMQAHVETEKHLYGVTDKEAEVFDIRFEGSCRFGSIPASLKLSLNERTGEFEVLSNDLDDAFLKNNFESGTLIQSLPDSVFEPKKGMEVMRWRDSDPDWDSMTFYIPYDVKLEDKDLAILDGNSCRSERDVTYSTLEGCDMAVIKSSGLGYEYCFVRRPTTVTGHDGQEECRVAVRRTIGKEEIDRLVDPLVEGIDVSDANGLDKAIRISEIVKNDGMAQDIARKHLLKIPVRIAMRNLEKHSKKSWFRKIPDILEEVLNEKSLDARGILAEMQGVGVKLPGHVIIQRLKTGSVEDDVVTADLLSAVLKTPESAITELGLNEYISESILAGRTRDYKSGILASASNAAKLLQKLKDLFGMVSLSDYSFDLESYSTEDHGTISRDISTFGSDIDKLKPVIGRTEGYREISGYKEFFQGVGGFFSERKGDRSSGIELGVRLEELLRSMGLEGTMDEMLKEARNSEKISENDYGQLDSLRQYRNACAHQVEFEPASKKSLKTWTSMIGRMENELKGVSP